MLLLASSLQAQILPGSGTNSDVEYASIRDIELYTSSFCNDCRRLRKHLKDHKVRFREVSLTETLLYSWQSLLSNRKPPITVVTYSDGSRRRIFGFDERLINALVGITPQTEQDSFEMSDFDVRSPVPASADDFQHRHPDDAGSDSFDIRK